MPSTSRSLATNDTFVIYSHSHGNAVGTYFASWPDLADAILKIPARNVVVLTMSCHSGYLAEALQAKRNLWEGRTKSGRNLIVLTSVSPDQSSGPSPEPGIGNPFTYAVTTAIQGAADGFSGRPKDGRIEMQEFVDYIRETANEHSRGQVHRPQAAGEYLPQAVLFPANLATHPGRIERFHLDGEHWTCIADGKPIGGLLLKPGGTGPFPAVILSHGLGGNAEGIMAAMGRQCVQWGFIAIATSYTHAGKPGRGRSDPTRMDFTQTGARPENIRRALVCLEILRQQKDVDTRRIAAYGHSMGAFVTIALGANTDQLAAAAITSGGIATEHYQRGSAPSAETAAQVRTPFLILQGANDTTVPPEASERLRQILDQNKVPNERHVFDGVGHNVPAERATEVRRLMREWFTRHGLLPPS